MLIDSESLSVSSSLILSLSLSLALRYEAHRSVATANAVLHRDRERT